MKFLVAILSIMLPLLSMAQKPKHDYYSVVPEEKWSKSLEEKRGFQKIKLGSKFDVFIKSQKKENIVMTKGKLKTENSIFVKNCSEYSIDDIQIKLLIVSTYTDTINKISFDFDYSDFDNILRAFITAYGEPELIGKYSYSYNWESENVRLRLTKSKFSGSVYYEYKPFVWKMMADNYNKNNERASKL